MNQLETFEIEVNHTTGVTKLSKMPGDCTAFKIPRDKMGAFLGNTNELDKCGVYFLLADGQTREVYVGESEPVAKRMKQHLQNPQFAWEEAIVFVGSGNLTWGKGDIKYMEHGLYTELTQCSQYRLMNGNTPQQATVVHPNVWNSIIDGIKVLVPFLGHPKLFLRRNTIQNAITSNSKRSVKKNRSQKKSTIVKSVSPAYLKCPYSVASLMGAVVLKLAEDGKLTQAEVSYLLSQQATLDFKMQGNRYLKISTGAPNEHKNAKGVYRFMPDRKLVFGGSSYLLSRQLFPKSFDSVKAWISKHGYNLQQAVSLCKKMGMKPK